MGLFVHSGIFYPECITQSFSKFFLWSDPNNIKNKNIHTYIQKDPLVIFGIVVNNNGDTNTYKLFMTVMCNSTKKVNYEGVLILSYNRVINLGG